ncbi:MAG: winged helix-turn-helix transcriptional regulator [Candidatus Thermoplasmatota archaeon]|nr:winged helix-turn-helix transcriptional regulator [Candidatus Thermoplasmatota archaeon]
MSPDIKLFEDSETLKIGLEKSRRQILDLLRVKNMTISQVAEALEKDQSTVYRHIKKLEEAGFIEVKGERKEHHIPERIYGRTAEVFLMAPEPISSGNTSAFGIAWNDEKVKECINMLEDIGYEVEKEGVIEELVDHFSELDREVNEELSRSLDEDSKIDFSSLMQIKFLISLIKIENSGPELEEVKEIISRFKPPE